MAQRTATPTAYQPGDRVAWTSRWDRKFYTGTVERDFIADQLVVEQDPQPGDTHRVTWHIPAQDLRPLDGPDARDGDQPAPTAPAPKVLGHLRKQPRRASGKVGTPHQRAMLAYRNAGKLTAADYLAQIGADGDTIRRFASPFGRKVAQAYRAATGSEPTRSGAALVRGQLMRVFAYADRALLESAARDYHATAALVAA